MVHLQYIYLALLVYCISYVSGKTPKNTTYIDNKSRPHNYSLSNLLGITHNPFSHTNFRY